MLPRDAGLHFARVVERRCRGRSGGRRRGARAPGARSSSPGWGRRRSWSSRAVRRPRAGQRWRCASWRRTSRPRLAALRSIMPLWRRALLGGLRRPEVQGESSPMWGGSSPSRNSRYCPGRRDKQPSGDSGAEVFSLPQSALRPLVCLFPPPWRESDPQVGHRFRPGVVGLQSYPRSRQQYRKCGEDRR